MKNYFLYDSDGHIRIFGSCLDEDFPLQSRDGLVLCEGLARPEAHYVNNGVLTEYTPEQAQAKQQMPFYLRWSNAEMRAIDERPLESLRDNKWQTIKSARQAEIYSPITTPYGVFDADATSQKNITDAIMMLQTLAGLGQPSTVNFVRFDNTATELDVSQMVNIGLLLGQRTQAAITKSTTLRQQIAAASSAEQLEAISWN